MDWKKFAKGETISGDSQLTSLDTMEEDEKRERDLTPTREKKSAPDRSTKYAGSAKTQKKMERQGFTNPSRVSKHAYETLGIASGVDKFTNTSGLLTTLDISKQAAFNYYNNQLQHNMLLASQNDELIKQNDVIIDQNEEIIKLLSQIANK